MFKSADPRPPPTVGAVQGGETHVDCLKPQPADGGNYQQVSLKNKQHKSAERKHTPICITKQRETQEIPKPAILQTILTLKRFRLLVYMT